MAYNNGFPVGYPQYYPQYYQPAYQMPLQSTTVQTQQMQTPVNAQPQNTGMTWVQGMAGAKSFLVAPNATVTLWDSEAPVIYLKSADATGMPSMKILDYTIRDQQSATNNLPPATSEPVYVTKEDFDQLRGELDHMKSRFESIQNRAFKSQRKEAAE